MVKFSPTVKREFIYGTVNSTSASEFGASLLSRATLFQESINQLVKAGRQRRPNGDGKRLTGEQKRVGSDASRRPHHTDTRIRRAFFFFFFWTPLGVPPSKIKKKKNKNNSVRCRTVLFSSPSFRRIVGFVVRVSVWGRLTLEVGT